MHNSPSNQSGNGHEKPLVLARPRSPEEEGYESRKALAFELRRSVRSLKIDASAKFFFDALLDDTFLYMFGGDGHGSMVASKSDLAERYQHDQESIARWAQVLSDKGLIWLKRFHDYTEWHITEMSPPPVRTASPIQRARARASSERTRESKSGGCRFVPSDPEKPDLPRKSGGSRKTNRVNADSGSASPGSSAGIPRIECRHRTGGKGGEMPIQYPGDADHRSGSPGNTNREIRIHEPGDPDTRLASKGSGQAIRTVAMGRKAPLETSPDVRTLESGALSVQRCNASAKRGRENGFLLDVEQVMRAYHPAFATREMSQSGAWWRMAYRSDAGKAERVLAEVARMIKEGEKFSENPGACAVDLWRRFA